MLSLVFAFLAGVLVSVFLQSKGYRLPFGLSPGVVVDQDDSSDLVPARPGKRRGSVYMVLFDGVILSVHRAKEVAAGIKSSGVVYPAGILHAVELPALRLYFVALDKVALANHRGLELARQSIAFPALFKGGGDYRRLLEVGALIVPILVCILLWSQFSAVQSSLNRLDATVMVVKEVLSKPLVIEGK